MFLKDTSILCIYISIHIKGCRLCKLYIIIYTNYIYQDIYTILPNPLMFGTLSITFNIPLNLLIQFSTDWPPSQSDWPISCFKNVSCICFVENWLIRWWKGRWNRGRDREISHLENTNSWAEGPQWRSISGRLAAWRRAGGHRQLG